VMVATLGCIWWPRRWWAVTLGWRSVGIGALRLVLRLRLRRIAGIVAVLLLLLLIADAIRTLWRRYARSSGSGLWSWPTGTALLLLVGRLLATGLWLLLLGILGSRQGSIVGTLLICKAEQG